MFRKKHALALAACIWVLVIMTGIALSAAPIRNAHADEYACAESLEDDGSACVVQSDDDEDDEDWEDVDSDWDDEDYESGSDDNYDCDV
ncbi:MAG: hypothetical protein Q4A07_02755 [Coriobacteriales bacterium]|nr:hypothetical protein [Coriobacteriales bacterium]